ncbi:MAG: hypothetical protein MMC23_000011 [Stictis urceolatum]|nr:hypothetical protein [Stictis urceolata]
MPKTNPPIEDVMPPLICGTGTFNTQYNADPFALPASSIVGRALSLGVRAFDTSPYYGPSEKILGDALVSPFVCENFTRKDYFLVTKAGRVSSNRFDYSPRLIRKSVERSLERLRTDYLDVVYCHDVEFVSSEEVLEAVRTLRTIRDTTGTIKYVGISGYPVPVLCDLAELILRKTGEPLDAVMSYANFTLQNSALLTQGLERLKAARVGVVPNASILGMGLLRTDGLPVGSQGDWHPAPQGLRQAARTAGEFCLRAGDRIEKVAIRYSVEGWLHAGSEVGSRGDPASGIPFKPESIEEVGGRRLGVSVMGVSSVSELDETVSVWRSILDTLDGGKNKGRQPDEKTWGEERARVVMSRARAVRDCFGAWADFAWSSPPRGFVNEQPKEEEAHLEQQPEVEPIEIQKSFAGVKEMMPVGKIEFVDANQDSIVQTEQMSEPGSSPSPKQVATILPDF